MSYLFLWYIAGITLDVLTLPSWQEVLFMLKELGGKCIINLAMNSFQHRNIDYSLFKISYKDHFRVAKMILIHGAIYLIFILVAVVSKFQDYQLYILIAAVVLTLANLPAIIIHISYYKRNKNITLRVFCDRFEVIKDHQIIFTFIPEQIIACDVYLSATMNQYKMGNGLPNEEYQHAVFLTATGKFSVTNMLYPNPVFLAQNYNVKVTIHETLFTI